MEHAKKPQAHLARSALQRNPPKLAPLELLPAEIKLQILYNMPTIWALCHMTRSSPTYHELYISERERIFSRVTMNELHKKGIDNFTPDTLFEVRLQPDVKMSDVLCSKINAALDEIHDQLSTPKTPLVLSLHHCLALHRLDNAVEWVVSVGPSNGKVKVKYRRVPDHESKYWTQHQDYYQAVVVKASPPMTNSFERVLGTMKAEKTFWKSLRDIKEEYRLY